MKKSLKKFQVNKGFTLIEIMVALMIFSLVVVVALAALVKIVDANRKAQTITDAVVNISFAMESMTRELRTGSSYYCQVLALGFDLSVPPTFLSDISTCTGTAGDTTPPSGVGFAFLSSRAATCPATSNRLITAYEIVPNMSGGVFDGTFSFKKATQDSCGGTLNFIPVVSTKAVSITNYYLQAHDVDYPIIFIKLDGTAGTSLSGQTSFTLQTAATSRVP